MENDMEASGSAAAPGTRFSAWRGRARRWLWRLRRKLPYLVWYGDELDVGVTFSECCLPSGQPPSEALRSLYSGQLHDAETSLRGYGVSFDTGLGLEGRDWEWDFSLEGPVSVQFRGRASHPERRLARPKPRLVVNNDAA